MDGANRVLIVEDHQATRETLTFLFEKEGFIVREADSIAGARESFRCESPSIALVDVGLPDGSGLDLLEAFAGMNPKTPVIVVTASDQRGLSREAMKRGAFRFIQKPYGFADLLAAVHDALDGGAQ